MNTLVRRPLVINPALFASVFGDISAQGKRMFENLSAPYRFDRDGDSRVVSVDLAGFTKDDINVSVDESTNVLTITASASSSDETEVAKDGSDNEAEGTNSESAPRAVHGFYNRKVNLNFTLPENVDFETVNSQYADGVLKVSFGTKEPEKVEPRKIAVS